MWKWHTDILVLCFWLAQNYMKICFRNICSANVKWKRCTRRIEHNWFFSVLWLTQVGFLSQLPLTHLTSWCFFFFFFLFFCHYCHLLSFLKNHKTVMSLTFALQVIYFTASIMIKILARVARNKSSCQTSFPAKPVPILDAEFL